MEGIGWLLVDVARPGGMAGGKSAKAILACAIVVVLMSQLGGSRDTASKMLEIRNL